MQPETIRRSFDPARDVPRWVRGDDNLVALAQRNYAFRCALWAAKTAQTRRFLRRKAQAAVSA